MKGLAYSILGIAFLFFSCKKEKPSSYTPEPVPEPSTELPLPACSNLPPAPPPFGWKDSTNNEDENVNFFRANPVYPGVYIYCVNGKIFPQNRVYFYTYNTGIRQCVSEIGDYLPDVNANGWMVFSKPDQNIYKVKLNGDSLTQITFNNLCLNPKWDHTGKFIYCYQKANGTYPSYLLRITPQGQGAGSNFVDYPNTVPCKSSDKVYYLKTDNQKLSLYIWDRAVNSETLMSTSSFSFSGYQNDFFDLQIDNQEAYLYWSNNRGIMRYEIASHLCDTLLKNCPNYTFLHPQISDNGEELSISCKVLSPLNSKILYRQYKCIELNLKNHLWRELQFFPH
ncbi:MAG TPA: hypothetical protein PLQ93_11175 [Bacteroidia bacterium]|nr:hypothetical protein [Bacteroidia bacterium]